MIDHNDDLRFFVWKNENEPYYFQYVSNGVLKLFMDDHCWFCQLTPGHADKDGLERWITHFRPSLALSLSTMAMTTAPRLLPNI